ncbi:MAG: hypothetical protein R6U32_06790 [Candidatus Woesearchaeota archaeon]
MGLKSIFEAWSKKRAKKHLGSILAENDDIKSSFEEDFSRSNVFDLLNNYAIAYEYAKKLGNMEAEGVQNQAREIVVDSYQREATERMADKILFDSYQVIGNDGMVDTEASAHVKTTIERVLSDFHPERYLSEVRLRDEVSFESVLEKMETKCPLELLESTPIFRRIKSEGGKLVRNLYGIETHPEEDTLVVKYRLSESGFDARHVEVSYRANSLFDARDKMKEIKSSKMFSLGLEAKVFQNGKRIAKIDSEGVIRDLRNLQAYITGIYQSYDRDVNEGKIRDVATEMETTFLELKDRIEPMELAHQLVGVLNDKTEIPSFYPFGTFGGSAYAEVWNILKEKHGANPLAEYDY